MTAEVAILNRNAVVLAADSAVTIGRRRVWKHSSKLFLLSDYNDIGIMIHNAADYRGVPWQIIIKQFRREIGKERFATVSEASERFVDYLKSFPLPTKHADIDKDGSEVSIYQLIFSSLDECQAWVERDGSKKRTDKRKSFEVAAKALSKQTRGLGVNFGVEKSDFESKYSKIISDALDSLNEFSVTKACKEAFFELCYSRSNGAFETSLDTGLILSGYGSDDIFPALVEFVVDGAICDVPRVWTSQKRDMNVDLTARIIPFGQTDIAYLYMEGILPEYLSFLEKTISETLKEKSGRLIKDYVPQVDRVVERRAQAKDNDILLEKLFEGFKVVRNQVSVKKVVGALSSLPKEEMAALAESLIEITSLRRRVDSNLETVGGPVDVAVISKADGFVWIKRKHYFDMELNHDFLHRRNERYGDKDDDSNN